VFENLREVQPHVFFAVPRVWEKIYSQVMIALKRGRRCSARLRLALRIGTGGRNVHAGGPRAGLGPEAALPPGALAGAGQRASA
jgi:long-chain acyl-CoA synthetase